MRGRWMTAAAAALALAACSPADERRTEEDRVQREPGPADANTEWGQATGAGHTQNQGPAPNEQPGGSPPRAVPDSARGLTVAGSFRAYNAYPVTATLSAGAPGGTARGTLVTVAVTDAPPDNPEFQVALHEGSCAAPGRAVEQLTRVRLGATRTGGMADTLALDASRVLDGNHVVVLKTAGAGAATPPVACASLPRNPPNA